MRGRRWPVRRGSPQEDLWGVPAVAVPAVNRDSELVARRKRATSPSPSVWPLMAADGPMRTGRERRLQARQSRSRHGRSAARRARLAVAEAGWMLAGLGSVFSRFDSEWRAGLGAGPPSRGHADPARTRCRRRMCPGQACLRRQFRSRAGGLGGRLRRFGKPSRLRAATIAELATIESPRPSRRRRGGSSSSTVTSVPLSPYKKDGDMTVMTMGQILIT